MDEGSFGIETGHQFPLLDRREVLLTSDNNNFVRPDGVRESFDIRVCHTSVFALQTRLWNIPLIVWRSMSVMTAPKLYFSLALFSICCTVKVASGASLPGDILGSFQLCYKNVVVRYPGPRFTGVGSRLRFALSYELVLLRCDSYTYFYFGGLPRWCAVINPILPAARSEKLHHVNH
jgi:hypothetical protein